jgi:death on curing protein
VWLGVPIVEAIHGEQLQQHGGRVGIRDVGLLESALARPLNRNAYERATVHELAAEIGFGIARNHPFVDGNKRTAFVAAALFLEMNGMQMTAPEADVVLTFLALAAGRLSVAELSVFFERHTKPVAR